MTIKTPITDVDAIRGLASRALAGLARSESVRQIISKLPLFNSGQLQSMYIIIFTVIGVYEFIEIQMFLFLFMYS